jgi:hypothetical protein
MNILPAEQNPEASGIRLRKNIYARPRAAFQGCAGTIQDTGKFRQGFERLSMC